MDVRQGAVRSARRARGDPAARGADGGGESHLGLHADPRRAEERWASGGTIDDRSDPEGAWALARARAAHVVADVPASALGRHRRRGFLHEGSLDLARFGDYTVFVIDLTS